MAHHSQCLHILQGDRQETDYQVYAQKLKCNTAVLAGIFRTMY